MDVAINISLFVAGHIWNTNTYRYFLKKKKMDEITTDSGKIIQRDRINLI